MLRKLIYLLVLSASPLWGACTANCTSIAISWAATVQPAQFQGYQVVVKPPAGTSAAIIFTPAQTGGAASTGFTYSTGGGQLFSGIYTITLTAMGAGPSPPGITTTMSYSAVCAK